jgi:hypothetical protein
LRIDDADHGAASAWPRRLIDEPESVLRRLGQRKRDIVDAQGKVVEALAAPSYETPDIRILGQGLEQLDAGRPGAEKRDPQPRKPFVALQPQAKAFLEMRSGRINRSDGPAKVVDHGHTGCQFQSWRSNKNRPSTGTY